MKAVLIFVALSMSTGVALAEEGHADLKELCKVECPTAASEEDAVKCVEKITKEKKQDRKFKKSDCYSAYKEHAEHESKSGHKH